MRRKKKAASKATAAAAIPVCDVRRQGGNLQIELRVEGLLAAGGLFEVVPLTGSIPPVLEERWEMTVGDTGVDQHKMKTAAKELKGDGIRFRINLCALSNQFPDGSLTVTVSQDGVNRPIVPPMSFELPGVVPCESNAAKLAPVSVVSGFAINPAD